MSELALEQPIGIEPNPSPLTQVNAYVGVNMLNVAAFFDQLKRRDLSELKGRKLAYGRAKKIGGGVLLGLSIKFGVPPYLVDALSSGAATQEQ